MKKEGQNKYDDDEKKELKGFARVKWEDFKRLGFANKPRSYLRKHGFTNQEINYLVDAGEYEEPKGKPGRIRKDSKKKVVPVINGALKTKAPSSAIMKDLNKDLQKDIEGINNRDDTGKIKKGNISPLKKENKFTEDALFIHETNEIKIIESASNLNFLQRGKKYQTFKDKYNLSDQQLSEIFGKSRGQVSREIRFHKKSQLYNIDTEKQIPERVLMQALEMPPKAGQNFIDDYEEYKGIGFNDLCKLYKKTTTPELLYRKLEDDYTKKKTLLQKWAEKHSKRL